jgi:Raf kinase inhibitor-like YbhB/YbcL family protein
MSDYERIRWCLILILLAAIFGFSESALAETPLTVASPAFAPGTTIPTDFTCSGADRSPPLEWHGAPKSTQSYALIVDDPDAPGGKFIHWVAYNFPATATSIAEGVPKTARIPGGGINGVNSFGHLGYNGPCPPPGSVHHYRFRVFALDAPVTLSEGADASALEKAIKGHIVAEGELVGTFSR